MNRILTSGTQLRYAIIGLVGIALVLTAAFNFQRLPLVGGGETYRAEFTDASGLVTGEGVRMAGVKVGTVTDIELGENRVIVSFTVEGADLGDRTTAGIEVKTLLGQHYLSITPAGDGAMEANGLIPLERTDTPVNVVPAFAQLSTTVERIDTDQVTEALDTVTKSMNATAPELDDTLDGLSRISRSISSRDEEIRELFDRTERVSSVVAARDQELAQLLTDTSVVLEELDRRRDVIEQIIEGASALSAQLIGVARDNDKTLKPALTKLNRVLDVLQANKEEIDRTITIGGTYAREFTNVGGSGRWFDATIKFPRGYAVCATESVLPDTGLNDILTDVLSTLNEATNDSTKPCIPLGPASDSTQ